MITKIIFSDRICIVGFVSTSHKKVIFDISSSSKYNYEIIFRDVVPLEKPVTIFQKKLKGDIKLYFRDNDVFLAVCSYFLNLRTNKLIESSSHDYSNYELCPQEFYITV